MVKKTTKKSPVDLESMGVKIEDKEAGYMKDDETCEPEKVVTKDFQFEVDNENRQGENPKTGSLFDEALADFEDDSVNNEEEKRKLAEEIMILKKKIEKAKGMLLERQKKLKEMIQNER